MLLIWTWLFTKLKKAGKQKVKDPYQMARRPHRHWTNGKQTKLKSYHK